MPSATAPIIAPLGHVLLVDDDPSIRASYAQVLRRRGYSYRVASSGLEAQAFLATEQFDAVLSDICMPGLDGIGLLRLMRSSGNPVSFVFMTGSPQTQYAIDALELGATRFLLKPADIDELGNAVDDAVNRGREARQNREWKEQARQQSEQETRDEKRFDAAIRGLWPAFQPIVDAKTGTPLAYEALMRTTCMEISSPPELLSIAERSGRLDFLERLMRERIAQSMEVAPEGVLFFINLHPSDLLDEALYSPESPLTRHASRVVLEITERASLSTLDNLDRRLEALRKLGFRIAVDDLGSGYSGLNSLAELRPEFVKLDAALIRGLHKDPVKQRLVTGIARLCRDQGATVIAEGVEDAEERNALLNCDCDWLQGYFFARPARLFDVSAAQAV